MKLGKNFINEIGEVILASRNVVAVAFMRVLYQDRIHHRRMECVGRMQPARRYRAGLQSLFERRNSVLVAGKRHDLVGANVEVDVFQDAQTLAAR